MKIPIDMKCEKCGETGRVFMDLNADSVDWFCKCGHAIPQISTSYLLIGPLILRRALYELKEQNDIPMSMVLSAAAADCELSRLHFKWTRIAELEQRREITDEELEKQLRSCGRVMEKLEGVATLMHPAGLTNFVMGRVDILDLIKPGFPSLDMDRLAEGITRVLFWPRNRILHLGQTAYDLAAGRKSFNVATLVIHIYQAMDEVRRNRSNG